MSRMISCMAGVCLLLSALLYCLLGGGGRAEAFQGPLYTRNSHPLFVGMGNPALESAGLQQFNSVCFTYASTYLVDGNDEWDFNIDLESFIMDIRMKRIVDKELEVSLTIPVISYNDGVLDGLLAEYHDAFGLNDYGRDRRPDNEFLFNVSRRGRILIDGEAGRMAVGDIKLELKQILYSGDTSISFAGFVDFPTGNADHGYGNGNFDWGLALYMDQPLGQTTMLYVNAGYAFSESYEGREEINLRNYLFGSAGIEWVYSRTLSLYTQFVIQGSPYEDTGMREVDGTVSILTFGSRHITGKNSIVEFSFSEDTNTAGAPDFTVSLSSIYMF